MHVLLVWPRNERALLSDELSCCEPLPLEYLAGALRPDHDVRIHDLRLDSPLAELACSIEAPGVVGLALPYTTAIPAARSTAIELKRLWPNTPLVIGGHHPTVSREWLDGFPADYVISGEGGLLLKHLIECLESGRQVEELPGLSRFGQVIPAQPRLKPLTLDDVPSPDRSLLARHRQDYFHSIYRPVALMRFSAGCPYRCNFCSLWVMTDRRYLTKEIPRILRELGDIDLANVYVVDDEAFIQPRRMQELADGIASSGISKRYHMYLRTDTALRHSSVIERWAEIGLDSVLVGAESMDDAELDGYQKGTNARQTRDAIALFHSLKIKVRANFIVRPTWGEEDFLRLRYLVDELEIDMPSFSVLTPLPGTELYESVRDRLISRNPELFDCYHTLLPTQLPIERFYDALALLMEATASRTSPGVLSASDPSVFYFSNRSAFDRMMHALRNGSSLNGERWEIPASQESGR